VIFIDTWAWVALASKHDQHHRRARAQHKALQKSPSRYVTSDFVLSEVIAHLYTTLTARQAQAFINAILGAADSGNYDFVHVSPLQFRRAWQMRQKYHDKPDISFVDFTSMVVMQDRGISEVSRATNISAKWVSGSRWCHEPQAGVSGSSPYPGLFDSEVVHAGRHFPRRR
jgi:predicted nucleic acid-binding protein